MPRKAPPGHRLPIEAALDALEIPPDAGGRCTLLGALDVACEVLSIPRGRWQDQATLQRFFEAVAALSMVRRELAVDPDLSQGQALDLVAIRLGLNPDTVRAWWYDAQRQVRRRPQRRRARNSVKATEAAPPVG